MSSAPPDFRGDLEGYLAWAAENWRPSPIFCAEHWAPCPVEGKNGLIASTLLMEKAIERMPDDVRGNVAKMNAWMDGREQPLCCELGDDAMGELWAQA